MNTVTQVYLSNEPHQSDWTSIKEISLPNFTCKFQTSLNVHLKYVLFLEAALLSSLLNNAQVFTKSDVVKPPVLGLIGAELYG